MVVALRDGSGIDVLSADSALGRWTVATWVPSDASELANVVLRVWYFDGSMSHARERVFPDGAAELVVMLDDPHRDGDAETDEPFPAVCINGLRTRPSVVVAPNGRCRVLGIRLTPLGACRVVGDTIRDLRNVTVDLSAALGRVAGRLAERFSDAAGTHWNARSNALAVIDSAVEWTAQQVRGSAPVDPVLSYVAHEIERTKGTLPLERVTSSLAMQRSVVARRFKQCAGVTPSNALPESCGFVKRSRCSDGTRTPAGPPLNSPILTKRTCIAISRNSPG